jgi:hypothetical protein
MNWRLVAISSKCMFSNYDHQLDKELDMKIDFLIINYLVAIAKTLVYLYLFPST